MERVRIEGERARKEGKTDKKEREKGEGLAVLVAAFLAVWTTLPRYVPSMIYLFPLSNNQ